MINDYSQPSKRERNLEYVNMMTKSDYSHTKRNTEKGQICEYESKKQYSLSRRMQIGGQGVRMRRSEVITYTL